MRYEKRDLTRTARPAATWAFPNISCIGVIPVELGELRALEFLSLWHNNLCGEALVAFSSLSIVLKLFRRIVVNRIKSHTNKEGIATFQASFPTLRLCSIEARYTW